MRREAAGAVVVGGAGVVGKEAATAGLRLLRPLLQDEWPRIQLGLVMAWRTVSDWFVR